MVLRDRQLARLWQSGFYGVHPLRGSIILGFILGLQALLTQRLRGENHFDYRYDNYQENDDRITVRTHSAFLELVVRPSVTLDAQFVYDGISGATPTGAPPPPGSNRVPLAKMNDVRTAGDLKSSFRWGRNTTTPEFSYSLEDDYESVGLSLNHTVDLNEKNTTLAFGFAYTHDTIMPEFWDGDNEYKNGGDALIGVTQLLGANTIFTANFTFGMAKGYLSDPYKGFRFSDYPDPETIFPENRPDERLKTIGYFSLTHFVTPLKGSAELSYRLYHDSFSILSHTVALNWFQKIGKHVVLSPMFRFMDQSEADFYAVQLPGDPLLSPGDPGFMGIPKHYSADYRLSALQTFTLGLSGTVKIKDRVSLDLSYQHYRMVGKDNETSASAYPTANIVSAGFRIWF